MSKAKDVFFAEDIRPAFKRGVEKLANAVKETLGPSGLNVAIYKGAGKVPLVTKDGVTVANHIRLSDELESLGAIMIQEVANKANLSAGDGTTTATVLAEAILNAAMKVVSTGVNPIVLKREIDETCSMIVDELEKNKKEIKSYQDIFHVAKVALNGDDKLANLIAEAFEKVGPSGSIVTETNPEPQSTLNFVEGMQLERGFLSSYFCNIGYKAEYENAKFYIVYDKISTVDQIKAPVTYSHENNVPLIISCEDMHDSVLSFLATNVQRNGLKVVAINNPGSGDNKYEYVDDFANVVGATIFGEGDTPYKNFTADCLGECKKVKVGIEETAIIGGKGDTSYLEKNLEDRLKDLPADQSLAKKLIRDRLNRLRGKIAILKLGNYVDIELMDTKLRVEDAINATKSALEKGVLPGGGVALLRAGKAIKDKIETTGGMIILDILSQPIESILRNTSESVERIVFEVEKSDKYWYGYDAASKVFGDMFKLGIVDPVEVTKSSFLNAAAAASMLVTTSAAIINAKKEEKK